MLSLSPRYDLFKFTLPKDFIPDEVTKKYSKWLNKNSSVITTPIDYLNESIKGVTFPGLQDLVINQPQTSKHAILQPRPDYGGSKSPLGRIKVEPSHDDTYVSPINPLSAISKEFTVTFRHNQGLVNYFMLYETILYKINKTVQHEGGEDVFDVYIIGELGNPNCKVTMEQMKVMSMDGLEFDYSKVERVAETFNVNFTFNNLDFQMMDINEY